MMSTRYLLIWTPLDQRAAIASMSAGAIFCSSPEASAWQQQNFWTCSISTLTPHHKNAAFFFRYAVLSPIL
jgi:hypothetical protein